MAAPGNFTTLAASGLVTFGLGANSGYYWTCSNGSGDGLWAALPSVGDYSSINLTAGATIGKVWQCTNSATGAGAWVSVASLSTSGTLTISNDTNITASLTGSSTTALFTPISINFAWSGILSPTRGGTGFNGAGLSLGDLLYASAGSVMTRLPGNSTTTRKFLISTGSGAAATAPIWDILQGSDIGNIITQFTSAGFGIAAPSNSYITTSNRTAVSGINYQVAIGGTYTAISSTTDIIDLDLTTTHTSNAAGLSNSQNINITPNLNATLGTISTHYGIYIQAGTNAGGTVTNAYGARITTPTYGTNNYALLTDDITVSGATPYSLLAFDANKKVVSIADYSGGFGTYVLTWTGSTTPPTWQVPTGGGGGGSGITSATGSANQILINGTTATQFSASTFTLASALIAPGSIQSTTTMAIATAISATVGLLNAFTFTGAASTYHGYDSTGTISLTSGSTSHTTGISITNTINTSGATVTIGAGIINSPTLRNTSGTFTNAYTYYSQPTVTGTTTIGTYATIYCDAPTATGTITTAYTAYFAAPPTAATASVAVWADSLQIGGTILATNAASGNINLGSSSIAASSLLATDASKNITTTTSTISPTFAGVTIGTLAGLLKATLGVVSAASAGTDYEAPITAGTASQYLKGNKTLGTFSTDVQAQISASGNLTYTTGNVTLNTTITGLTSVSSTGFTGALTGNASTATALSTAGTANQFWKNGNVWAQPTQNDITNLTTSSSPSFTGVTVSGIATGDKLTYFNTSKALAAVTLGAGNNLTLTTGTLDTAQGITTGSSPTFVNIILSGPTINRLSYFNGTGQISSVTLDANLTLTAGTLALNATITGLTSVSSTTFVGALTGNSSTATALSTAGTANQFWKNGNIWAQPAQADISGLTTASSPSFTGVTVSGLATGDVLAYFNTSKALAAVTLNANLTLTTGTLALNTTITGLTSVSSTGFTGALTGNASTATALSTAGTANQFWKNGNVWAQPAQADISGLTTASSPSFTGATLSGLATGDVLAYFNTSKAFAAVTLSGNLTLTTGTLALNTTITGLTSVSSTTFVGALTGNSSTATALSTAGSANQFWKNGNVWAQPAQADVSGLTTASSPTFTGVTLSGLATGDVLAYFNTSKAFAAVTLSGNLTLTTGTLALNTTITGLTSVSSTTFVGALTGNSSTATALSTAGSANQFWKNGNVWAQPAQADISGLTTASSPTFTGVTLSGLATGDVLAYFNTSKALAAVTLSSNLTLTTGTLDTVQGIQTTSNPQFNSLGIGVAAPGTAGYARINVRLGVAMAPSYPLDITGQSRLSSSLSINGSTPNTYTALDVGTGFTATGASSNSYGFNMSGTFIGTINATIANIYGINISSVLKLPSAAVGGSECAAIKITPAADANTFTIATLYGLYVATGTNVSGTVTVAYGSYVKVPTAGLTNVASYTDNLAIGTAGTAPPSNGLLVSGVIKNTNLSFNTLTYADGSSQLASVTLNSNITLTTGTLALNTTITGLTSVSSTGFTGALTGNASTATALSTAGTANQFWKNGNVWAQPAQADISGLTTASSPSFTGVTLSGLATGDVLAYFNTSKAFAAVTLSGNLTLTTGTLALNTTITGLTSVSSTTFVGALTGNSSTATALSTAGTTNQFWKNGNVWAQPAQADISGLTTASSPTFTGATLSGLATGDVLAYFNTSKALAAVTLNSNITLTTGTLALNTTITGLTSVSSTGFTGALTGNASTATALSTAGSANQFWKNGNVWAQPAQADISGLTTASSPSFTGLVISGATSYAPLIADNLKNVVSVTTGMSNAGWVFTSNGSSAAPTWQVGSGGSGVPSVTGAANQILINGGTGAVTTAASFTIDSTFVAPGSIRSTTTLGVVSAASVDIGLINGFTYSGVGGTDKSVENIAGSLSFSSTTTNNAASLLITSTITTTSTAVLTIAAGIANQTGFTANSSAATSVFYGIYNSPTLTNTQASDTLYTNYNKSSITLTSNLTNYYGDYVGGAVTSGAATLSNMYGQYVDTLTKATGTVTIAYGSYVKVPTAGSTNIASYTDNLAIGTTGTAPPASGLLVSGVIKNTNLSINTLTYADGSSQLASVTLNSNLTLTTGTLALNTTITGLTSVSSTTFVGALTGNSSTATALSTAGTANQFWKNGNVWAQPAQADISGLTTGSSPTFTGATLSGLATGDVLAYFNTSKAFAAVTLNSNITLTTGTLALNTTITGLTSVSSTGFTGALTGNASTATALSTAGSANQFWKNGNVWAQPTQADVSGLTTGSSPSFTGVTVSGLASGDVLAYFNTSKALAAVTLNSNITLTTGTLALNTTITGLTSVSSTGFTGALTGNASTATALSTSGTANQFWKNGNVWAQPTQADISGLTTGSSPTFTGATLSGLATGDVLAYFNTSKALAAVTLSSNLTLTTGTLDTVQGIQTTSNPQFNSLGIGVAASGTAGYARINVRLGVAMAPAYPLDITGQSRISSSLSINGSTPNTYTALDVGTGFTATGSTSSYGLNMSGTFVGGVVATIGNIYGINISSVMKLPIAAGGGSECAAIKITPAADANTFTIATLYGLYVATGTNVSGTVTVAYGSYVSVPTAGTSNIASYTDNLAIGTTGTAPPSNGLLVSGVIKNTNLSINTLTYADGSSQLASVTLNSNLTLTTGTLALNTTITGLTSVSSTGFTGALTGNASTATALSTAGSANQFWKNGNVWAQPAQADISGLTTGSSPSFTGVTVSGLATGDVLAYFNTSKALAAVTLNSNITLTTGTLALNTTITGLTSVSSTTFVGALTGNSSTATALSTAGSANQFWKNGNIWAQPAQADISGLTTGSSPSFTGATLSGLATGDVLAYFNTSKAFAAVTLNSNITLTTGTLALNTTITGLTSVSSTGFTGALTGNASTATALSTAGSANQFWKNGNVWAQPTQADISGLTTGSSPTFTGATLSGLATGDVLAYFNTSKTLASVTLNSNITLTTGTLALNTTITGLTSVSSTGFTGALTGNASTATALNTAGSANQFWKNGNVWAQPAQADISGLTTSSTPQFAGLGIGAAANSLYGIYNNTTVASVTTNNYSAYYSNGTYTLSTAATNTGIYANYFGNTIVTNHASATLAMAANIFSKPVFTNTAGLYSNGINLYLDNPTMTGTIDDAYGIFNNVPVGATTNYGYYQTGTFTKTSDIGMYLNNTFTPTSNSGTIYQSYSNPRFNTTTNTISDAYAASISPTFTIAGAFNLSNAYGMNVFVTNTINAAATLGASHGIRIGTTASGSNATAITNAYNLYLDSMTVSGSAVITTGYGIYNITPVGATSNYGYYQTGTFTKANDQSFQLSNTFSPTAGGTLYSIQNNPSLIIASGTFTVSNLYINHNNPTVNITSGSVITLANLYGLSINPSSVTMNTAAHVIQNYYGIRSESPAPTLANGANIQTAYSGYFAAPGFGSTKIALWTNDIRIGTATDYAPLMCDATTKNVSSITTGMSNVGWVLTSNGTGAAPTWQVGGAGGGVPSVTGVANQILINGTSTIQTTASTFTLPSAVIAPGSIQSTTTMAIVGAVNTLYGLYNNFSNASVATSNYASYYSDGTFTLATNVTNSLLTGLNIANTYVTNSATSTLSLAANIYSNPTFTNTTATAFSNASSLYLAQPTMSGTITNAYGIFLNAPLGATTNTAFYITGTFTKINDVGFNLSNTFNPASAATNQYQFLISPTFNANATNSISNAVGMRFNPTFSPTSVTTTAISNAYGLDMNVTAALQSATANILSNLYGINITLTASTSAGSVTSAYGLNINTISGSGGATINQAYGIVVNAPTVGTSGGNGNTAIKTTGTFVKGNDSALWLNSAFTPDAATTAVLSHLYIDGVFTTSSTFSITGASSAATAAYIKPTFTIGGASSAALITLPVAQYIAPIFNFDNTTTLATGQVFYGSYYKMGAITISSAANVISKTAAIYVDVPTAATLGSGSITTAYGVYITAPNIGTTNVALFTDDITLGASVTGSTVMYLDSNKKINSVATNGNAAYVLTNTTPPTWAAVSGGSGVPSVTGAANQILINGTTTLQTTASTFTLPSAIIAPGSIQSTTTMGIVSAISTTVGMNNGFTYTGAATATLYGELISGNFTINTTSGTPTVASLAITNTIATTTAGTITVAAGIYNTVSINCGTTAITNSVGIYNSPTFTSTVANTNNVYGIYNSPAITLTSNITAYSSEYIGGTVSSGAATLGTMYGLNIAALAKVTGTVTTAYGAYINVPTAGTTNIALYSTNANLNYAGVAPPTGGMIMSGKLGVGNNNPTNQLEVTGKARFSDSVICATGALATSATDGFIYIPTCAGIPSGAPTSQTGTCAMAYDTTNNDLYIYDGAWQKSTLNASGNTFETINNNNNCYPYALTYDGSNRYSTITYTAGGGNIVKTFSYNSDGTINTIVLTGAGLPTITYTTKTYTYTTGSLTSVAYS